MMTACEECIRSGWPLLATSSQDIQQRGKVRLFVVFTSSSLAVCEVLYLEFYLYKIVTLLAAKGYAAEKIRLDWIVCYFVLWSGS